MIKHSARVLALSALFATCLVLGRFASASAPQAITGLLTMQSQPGDWVGQGGSYDYSSPSGSFIANASASSGQADFVHVAYSDADHWWHLDFTTRQLGVPLAPGTYLNAERYPFEEVGHPGLSIGGDGRGCNTLIGEFTVEDSVFDYSVDPPRVVRFVATFVQHCGSNLAGMTGKITINGDPLPTPTPTALPTATPIATPTVTATPETKVGIVFLPLVLDTQPQLIVAINPDPIATRPIVQLGETYYTTTFTLNAPLPAEGHFYLSASVDSVVAVKVDDELTMLVDGEEVYTRFLTYPRVIELPRTLVESWTGQSVTVNFRDVHGSMVGSLPVWLIWVP